MYLFCFVVYRNRKLAAVNHFELERHEVPVFVRDWLQLTRKEIVVDDKEIAFIPDRHIRLFHWYTSVCNLCPLIRQRNYLDCEFHLIEVYE